jgi:hypothetical protein
MIEASPPDAAEIQARASIDRLVTAFFNAFSADSHGKVDLNKILDLFIPQALIVKACVAPAEIYSLREFIEPRNRLLNDGTLTNFQERELGAQTRIFGNIAQRLCLYRKTGRDAHGDFSTLGIKTIQLVRTDADWKISAMAWDDERPGLVIPQGWRSGVPTI